MESLSAMIALAMLATMAPADEGPSSKAEPAKPLTSPGGWFGPDSYPADAIRAGAEGRVVVTLAIDEQGFPVRCDVVTSAGNASLDHATCDIAMTRGRFAPARDAGGRAVASEFSLPIRWTLPDDTRTIPLDGGRTMMTDEAVQLSLDATGAVMACKATSDVGSAANICQNFPIGAVPFGVPTKGGKPVPATVTLTSQAYMDPN